MTMLPQQSTILQYEADGIETDYTVDYYVPISSIDSSPAIDVYVTLSGQTPTPATDIKVWNVDYTYAPNIAPLTGGIVTFLTGKIPPSASTVTLSRDVPAELDVEFSDAQNFSGANLDAILLLLMLNIQQVKTYALQRNLSYVINGFQEDANIEGNTQVPVLLNGYIWVGLNGMVTSAFLEENPNVSILRSQLENNSPGTDGATLVGYYDVQRSFSTTVHSQLSYMANQLNLIGTDTGAVNALILTVLNHDIDYFTGMVLKIFPINTTTDIATINFNGKGIKNIYRDQTTPSQPQDIISGKLLTLTYDGTRFIMSDYNTEASGTIKDFAGTVVEIGYLAMDAIPISKTTYNALYEKIGTTWNTGGEGAGNFRKPPSARRTCVGAGGVGTGVLANIVGSLGGAETSNQVPSHSHAIGAGFITNSAGLSVEITNASPNTAIGSNTDSNGGAHDIDLFQPSMVVTKMIKI